MLIPSHTDHQFYIKALQEFRTLVYVAELRCYAMLTIINIATCAWKILVKYVNIRSSFLVLAVSIFGADVDNFIGKYLTYIRHY